MSENHAPKLDVSDIVEQNYEMDPETDDIFTSDMLQYGMRVLVENPQDRESLKSMSLMERLGIEFDKTNLSRIRKLNRWCTVSHMRLTGDMVTFIGTYEDGVKCLRTASVNSAWIVKKDSIPAESDTEAEMWSKISTIMVEAAMIDRRFTDSERDRVVGSVGHYVDKVMEIFRTNLDVFIDDLGEEEYQVIRQRFFENDGEKKSTYRTWFEEMETTRIPIQAPEYLMDHHPDPNPTKIGGEPYDELVAKMVEGERTKQAQYLKDKAKFAEIHDSGYEVVDGGYEKREDRS